MVTHQKIAKALGVSRTVVTKVLNSDPQYRASAETRQRVWRAAKRLGYSLSCLRRIYRRQHPRTRLRLPVRVAVWVKDGTLWDKGVALLKDFSPGGGLLTVLKLSRGSLPVTPFRLRIEGPPPVGARTGSPVRWVMDGAVALGLRWGKVSAFPLSQPRVQIRADHHDR